MARKVPDTSRSHRDEKDLHKGDRSTKFKVESINRPIYPCRVQTKSQDTSETFGFSWVQGKMPVSMGKLVSRISSFAHQSCSLKLADLTPNKTRRAQCANWLLYYREQLFGYTLEELTERRRLKLGAVSEAEKNSTEWKSPVTEVF